MTPRGVLNKSATVGEDQAVPLLGQVASGFEQRAVAGPLRHHFDSIWIHRADDTRRRSAIVPDGCADLVFAKGVLRVSGPGRCAKIEWPRPGRVVVGLRFQPGAAASCLRTSAAQLVGITTPLECFWGSEARRLGDWLGEAASPQEIARRFEAALARRFEDLDPPEQMPRAIFHYVGTGTDGASSVTRLLRRQLGLSERTIRRYCIDAFGFGPKALDRILRFQRFLELARRANEADMAWLAASAGYADQAHLTREAHVLAGVTPTIVRAQFVDRARHRKDRPST